jgi:hypothetical protein
MSTFCPCHCVPWPVGPGTASQAEQEQEQEQEQEEKPQQGREAGQGRELEEATGCGVVGLHCVWPGHMFQVGGFVLVRRAIISDVLRDPGTPDREGSWARPDGNKNKTGRRMIRTVSGGLGGIEFGVPPIPCSPLSCQICQFKECMFRIASGSGLLAPE